MLSDVIFGLLFVGGGAYLFLAATDRLEISHDPEKVRRWQESWGKPAKWLGPSMVAIGAFRLLGV